MNKGLNKTMNDRTDRRRNHRIDKRSYIGLYTVLFAVFACGAFFLFALTGKSFVWNQDGGPQYVPYLAYMGNYLRDFIRRALHGDFTIQMYDFTIGYGDDVGSIVRAHPLDFLSVFVPMRYTEQLYTFLIFLRIYLAGLSFSAFCFYFTDKSSRVHAEWTDILTGALIYAFCGYTLRFGIVHPTFMSPFIILPLLLLAAERMMRQEGSLLLAFCVFLGFMSNYYFMYMSSIALVIYVLIRFPALFPKNRLRNFISLFFRMSGIFLLGTAMAMATLLPVIYMLSSSARLSSDSNVTGLLSYGDHRWLKLLVNLIAPRMDSGYASQLSLAAPVLPAAALLFTERREKKTGLKIGLLLVYLMLIIPAAAYVMSGFSTLNNRWMFIFVFVISFTYTVEAGHLRQLQGKEILLPGCVFVVYVAAAFAVCEGHPDVYRIFAMAMLGICTAGIYILNLCVRSGHVPDGGGKVSGAVMTALALICVTGNGWYLYHTAYGNFSSEFWNSGSVMSTILDSRFAWINRIEDEDFYRVDSNLVVSNLENYSVLLGYHPTSQYNSIINGPLTYWMLETESIGIGGIHRLQSLDGRPAMEALANVKYYFTSADGQQHVPYGFEKVEELSDVSYAVYRNTLPLSFGYTYDTCISSADYAELSAAEKELAQLSGAVVENVPAGMEQTDEITESSTDSNGGLISGMETVRAELPEKGTDASRTDEGYKVKALGSITIPYERRAGYTCYLRLIGMDTTKNSVYLDVSTSDLQTELPIRGTGQAYSLNRTEYTINLGYDEEDSLDEVKIVFRRKDSYSLEGAEFIYIPVSALEEIIQTRNEESLENVSFTLNTVSGTAHITGTRMMVFSIPYSKGWSVTVDGQKQDLLQVNTAWCGTVLAEGTHDIRLTYVSPGAIAGRLIAAAGWVLWCVTALFGIYRRRVSG